MLGFLYALGGLVFLSLAKVYWKKPVDEFGEWTALVWAYVMRFFVLLPIALYFGLTLLSPPLYLLYLAVSIVGAASVIALIKAIKGGVTSNSSVASAYPLLSIPLAVFLYAEPVSQVQIA